MSPPSVRKSRLLLAPPRLTAEKSPVMPPVVWIRLTELVVSALALCGALAAKPVTSSVPPSTALAAVMVGWKVPNSTSRLLPAAWVKIPPTFRVAASSIEVVALAAVV